MLDLSRIITFRDLKQTYAESIAANSASGTGPTWVTSMLVTDVGDQMCW